MAFWLIVARYHTAEAVGLSASLISLAVFLGSISTMGLGVGMIRFLPSTPIPKNHRINTSLTLAALTALVLGLIFLGGLELWSPAIKFVRDDLSYAIMFLIFTIGFAITPLVDSAFLAARKASYVLHRSLLYNGLRLPIPILVASVLGAFGIFFSFGVALLVAILISLFLLMPRLYPGFLAVPSFKLSSIRDMLSYSIGNHAANLLGMIPSGILPLIVLSKLSASSSAHFYIVWITASLLFMVPMSSAQSLFVEGSQQGAYFTEKAVRSIRLGIFLVVPGVLFLFFAGPFLLGLFGGDYSTEGLRLLRILVVSAFFVAINYTFTSYLRVKKRVGELILLSSIIGVGTVVASYFLLDSLGLSGVGIAFFLIQGTISGYILLRDPALVKRVAKMLLRF